MISYDQYENKIKKYAKFRGFMNRFKFLFIALFALIAGTVATLLALMGSMRGTIAIADGVVYGDSYDDPEGVTAFLSSVSYEYAREGSDEWSSEKPVKAGKYSVRAVSKKAIGKGYGKTVSFEIKKREVVFTIESDSVEYGSVPDDITLELIKGDSFDKSELLFIYADYAAEQTEVDLDESSLKIMNGTDDRTDCYIVRHDKQELTITKRSIEISLKELPFTYNGTAITYSPNAAPVTQTRLANGDVIEFGGVELYQEGGRVESAIYAGTYEARAIVDDIHIYKVINGRSYEVTCQYDFKPSATTFTIGKRALTVTTDSESKPYDGEQLSNKHYTIAPSTENSGLVEGDTFSDDEWVAPITNAGWVTNEIVAYTLTHEDSYDIIFNFGTLTITRRDVYVTSASSVEEVTYSGQLYGLSSVTMEDELFEAVASETPVTWVTSVQAPVDNVVEFTIRKIGSSKIEDKDNFNIVIEWGKLQLAQLEITVKISGVEKVYDGTPLSATPENGEVELTNGTTLGYGDELRTGTVGELHTITDVQTSGGEVIAVENGSYYRIYCGSEDRTNCYKITYIRETLKITPRHIWLLTNSGEYLYDGSAHSDGGCTVYEGENIVTVLDNSLELKDEAPAFTNYAATAGQTHNNVCSYRVSANYVIDRTEYGTITILQRPIAVTSNTNVFAYDGKAHSDGGYTAICTVNGEQGLIGNDKLIVDYAPEFTCVYETDGQTQNNICRYRVPSDNYRIEGDITYGTVLIIARSLHVVTASAEKIYDGTALYKNEYIETYYMGSGAKEEGLLNGDELTLLQEYSIENVWESGENKCTFAVPLMNGVSNYRIVGYDYGTLTITQRHIRVVTASAYKIYDGGELSKNEYIRVDFVGDGIIQEGEGLKNGAVLSVENVYSITNVRESGDNKCTFSVPTYNDTSNYKIVDYLFGTLTIDPKPITVRVSDVKVDYGDNYAVYPSGKGNFANSEECGFVGDDMLTISVQFDISSIQLVAGRIPVKWTDDGEVGCYEEVVLFSGAAFSGNDEKNYDFTYENGALWILQRVLQVIMLDAYTFYGEDLQPVEGQDMIYHTGGVYPSGVGNLKAVNGASVSSKGLLDGDSMEVTKIRYFDDIPTGSTEEHFVAPKNAGSYEIKPYEIIIYTSDGRQERTTDDEDGEDFGNYLIRYYVQGTLEIKKRPIVVTLNVIESTKYDGVAREYVSGGEWIERGSAGVQYRDQLILKDALVYGEQLNVRVSFDTDDEPIFFGMYGYSFDFTNSYIEAPNGEGGYETLEAGLDNYEISCEDRSFWISKRAVTIQLPDWTTVYGDEYWWGRYSALGYSVIKGDFVGDDKITDIYIWFSTAGARGHPNVGTHRAYGSVRWVQCSIPGYESRNVQDCYDITVNQGKIKVEQLEVSITVDKLTLTYGDLANQSIPNGYYVLPDPLPYDEVIVLDFAYAQGGELVTPRNVGFYDVIVSAVLQEGQSLDNYKITYKTYLDDTYFDLIDQTLENGLQITPLAITVTVGEQEVYYGEPIDENSVSCSPELPYGEKLGVELRAEKDGVEITPKYAGIYDIVIKDLYIIGNEAGLSNYEVARTDEIEKGTLTILPRPLKVRLDDLTVKYGEEVRYQSGHDGTNFTILNGYALAYDDVLNVLPYFDLSETSETRPDWGTYVIAPASYTILFEEQATVDGFFVADSYDLTIENATLTVERRVIEVTLNSVFDGSIYYDGKAHNYVAGNELIEGDGMAKDEKLIVAVKYYTIGTSRREVAAIAKAGEYEYEFDFVNSHVENGGLKGLDNYTISVSVVNCTILKRSISVELNDIESQVYGTPVYYEEYAGNYKAITAVLPEDGGLVEGEDLQLSVVFYVRGDRTTAYRNNSVLSFGEYEIGVIGTTVIGGDYADAENYIIEIGSKYFSVSKREVTVTLLDLETDYGEMPSYTKGEKNYAEIQNLAEGDTLTVTEVEFDLPERAVVGLYMGSVSLTAIAVYSADGVDVTDNYTFVGIVSDVRINPRSIVVETNRHQFVYDGDAHSDGGYTIYYVDQYGNRIEETELPYGDESALHEDFVGEGKLPSVTEYTGDYTLNVFEIVITNANANVAEFVMGNYLITYEYNYIWIEQLTLYIKTKSYHKVYDGEALYVEGDTIESCYYYVDNNAENGRMEGLVKDHEFVLLDGIEYINAGQWRNQAVGDILDSEGNSKMHNYTIASYAYGIITIEARNIYIYASSASKVYDGKPLYSPDSDYIVRFYPENNSEATPLEGAENVLVAGHAFITVTPSILNAGTINNNPYEGVIVAETMANVSENYKLIFEGGTLTVTKRPVYYSVYADFEMDYCNAAPPKEFEYTVQQGEPEDGYGILRDEWSRFTFSLGYFQGDVQITRFNAGTYTIRVVASAPDKMSENYELVAREMGTLTINRANLVLGLKNKSPLYESADQVVTISASDYLIEEGALAPGDQIVSMSLSRTSLSASENKLSVAVRIVKDSVVIREGTFNATGNYNITLLSGSIGFTARTVYFEQVVPDAIKTGANGRGLINYTGARYTVGDDDSLFRVLTYEKFMAGKWQNASPVIENYYGLLDKDVAVLKSATVGKDVGVYEQWVELNVNNTTTGNKMTKLYDIVLVMADGEDTSIEVLAQKAKVTLSAAFNDDLLNNAQTGITVLDSSLYIQSTEGLLEDHQLEVAIYKDVDGTVYIYIFIFTPRYKNGEVSSRTDKSTIYEVTAEFVSGIAPNVMLVDTSYYP